MNDLGLRISVKCPECEWRILDKTSPTSGTVSMKCPRCKSVVTVDLSLRRLLVGRIYTELRKVRL